jgi:hypothetical protein
MEHIELTVLERLVKENPNDMDLGKQIRKMMLEIKSQKNGIQQEVSK